MKFLKRNRPTQIEEESSNNKNKRGNIHLPNKSLFQPPSTSSPPQNRDKKDHNEQNLRQDSSGRNQVKAFCLGIDFLTVKLTNLPTKDDQWNDVFVFFKALHKVCFKKWNLAQKHPRWITTNYNKSADSCLHLNWLLL